MRAEGKCNIRKVLEINIIRKRKRSGLRRRQVDGVKRMYNGGMSREFQPKIEMVGEDVLLRQSRKTDVCYSLIMDKQIIIVNKQLLIK